MDNLWIIYGESMDNLWLVYGLYMVSIWIIHGESINNGWIIYTYLVGGWAIPLKNMSHSQLGWWLFPIYEFLSSKVMSWNFWQSLRLAFFQVGSDPKPQKDPVHVVMLNGKNSGPFFWSLKKLCPKDPSFLVIIFPMAMYEKYMNIWEKYMLMKLQYGIFFPSMYILMYSYMAMYVCSHLWNCSQSWLRFCFKNRRQNEPRTLVVACLCAAISLDLGWRVGTGRRSGG